MVTDYERVTERSETVRERESDNRRECRLQQNARGAVFI